MRAFHFLLIAIFVIILVYTGQVAMAQGLDLLSVFFDNIAAVGWPGQFNVDFMSYLILSALWVAWRHQFSAQGLALAAVASVGGGLFFTPYLLVASVAAKGNMTELLLGKSRAAS